MTDTRPSVMQYLLAASWSSPLLGAAGALLPAPPGLRAATPTRPCCATA